MFCGIDVASMVEHFLVVVQYSYYRLIAGRCGTYPKVLDCLLVCLIGGSNEMIMVNIGGFC